MATRGRELSSRKWKPLAVDYEVYDPVMVGSIDGTDCSPHDRAIERACNTTCKSGGEAFCSAFWPLL